jgi:hypothetical protein
MFEYKKSPSSLVDKNSVHLLSSISCSRNSEQFPSNTRSLGYRAQAHFHMVRVVVVQIVTDARYLLGAGW